MSSGQPYSGKLEDNFIVVSNEEGVNFLKERGYGFLKANKIFLNFVEASYLVYRGLLKVSVSNNREIDFKELVELGAKNDPDFWVKLNVYSDLRNRALIAKPGVDNLEFIVDWKRKSSVRRLLVRIVKEGVRLGFVEFEKMFRRALESGRELVIAIVDKEGTISYYTVEGVVDVRTEGSDSIEVYVEQKGSKETS